MESLPPIGIISYLPDEPAFREFRREHHHRQLEWLIKSSRAPVYVVAQNFTKSDFISNPRIHYLPADRIGPSAARNLLLQRFYNEPVPYFSILDDDTYLFSFDAPQDVSAPYDRFLHYLASLPIDLCSLVQYRWSRIRAGKFQLSPSFWTITPACFYRNFTREYGESFYFDEDRVLLEDLKFGFSVNKAGFRTYVANQTLLYHHAFRESTVFEDGQRRDMTVRQLLPKLSQELDHEITFAPQTHHEYPELSCDLNKAFAETDSAPGGFV